MNLETAGFLLTAATAIATVLGWFFTHKKQEELVETTRGHAVSDRELEALRTRLKTVAEINQSLNEVANAYGRLGVNASVRYDMEDGLKLIEKASESSERFDISWTSPDLKVLMKQLSSDENQKLKELVDEFSDQMINFSMKYSKLEPTMPDYDDRVARMAQDASEVGFRIYGIASSISEIFASLDRQMASEDKKQ